MTLKLANYSCRSKVLLRKGPVGSFTIIETDILHNLYIEGE